MANIVFDFDGTLANTLPAIIGLFDAWSGKEPLQPKDVDRFRNMTLREVVREIGLPWWRVPALIMKGRGDLALRMHEVQLFEGLQEVLEELDERGHMMYIVSSNSTENIQEFLNRNAIAQRFNGVYGNIGVFGKAKIIKNVLAHARLDPADSYYVGDETRDIEAARKAGVQSVAVGWGFNGNIILKAHNPDHFVAEPRELLDIFSK